MSIICDHCSEPIEDGEGQYAEDAKGDIFFTHKKCSRKFEAERGETLVWKQIKDVIDWPLWRIH